MTQLVWNDSYSVGVAKLDQQHHNLLQIINKLTEMQTNGRFPKSFFKSLNALVCYAEIHFSTEETYMHIRGYPQLGIQQQEHQDFVKRIFTTNQLLS